MVWIGHAMVLMGHGMAWMSQITMKVGGVGRGVCRGRVARCSRGVEALSLPPCLSVSLSRCLAVSVSLSVSLSLSRTRGVEAGGEGGERLPSLDLPSMSLAVPLSVCPCVCVSVCLSPPP